MATLARQKASSAPTWMWGRQVIGVSIMAICVSRQLQQLALSTTCLSELLVNAFPASSMRRGTPEKLGVRRINPYYAPC